jgi:tetrahydromethanopterin S-methyltransferase subunit C
MTHGHFSLAMGAASGIAASILQSPQPQGSMTPMVVPIVSALVGAVFSYAVLKTTVQTMERDVRDMRKDLGQVFDLLRDASVKIARIEGQLHRDE